MGNKMRVFAQNTVDMAEGFADDPIHVACDASLDEGDAVLRADFRPALMSSGREYFAQLEVEEALAVLAAIDVARDGADDGDGEAMDRVRARLERLVTYVRADRS